MSDPTARPAPVSLGPGPEDAPKVTAYRPLSLLAILGLGLGSLYAIVIGVGGLLAFLRGNPWLLPGWTAVFPIAAAALSVVALVRIQRSEGTLAGEKVARWGLLLSALVGLSYWGYVAATYYAVGSEADRFGQQFLDKLRAGDVVPAFLLTLPPGERPSEGPDLRAQVEARFNGTEPGRAGEFTAFNQMELVRVLGWTGPDTKIEPVGVEECKYTGGGYQVKLLYRVDSPKMGFVMDMIAQGNDGKGAEGRQWYIMWNKIAMRNEPKPRSSEQGQREVTAAMLSREYVTKEWVGALGSGKTHEAYLATLPPDERARVREAVARRVISLALTDGVARAALATSPDVVWEDVSPGYKAFMDGGLVRADKDLFFAPEATREEMIDLVRKGFRHPEQGFALGLAPDTRIRFPWFHIDGGRLVVEHDFTLRLPLDQPRYAIEGRVVLDCPEADVTSGSAYTWRVRSVDLTSGKSAFMRMSPDGGPGPGAAAVTPGSGMPMMPPRGGR
jgi:hypothetical protein